MTPTHPTFIDTFTKLNTPDEGFGTTLELTGKQRRTERSAERETMRIKRRMDRAGRSEEFEQFLAQNGRTGVISEVDIAAETFLTPVFDVLSSGNFATAGFTQELLRTGSAWEGFKQAGIEFANAMPFVDIEDARKPTFGDVFSEQDISFWGAGAAAFVLDVVIDPINLFPGALAAKALRTGGRTALTKSGRAGQSFEQIFIKEADLKRLGEAGEAVLSKRSLAESAMANEIVGIERRVSRLTANMNPHERIIFGLWMDQPMLFEAELRKLVNSGFIPAERVKELQSRAAEMQKFTNAMFRRERKWGIVDQMMWRDNYVYGIEALSPQLQRGYGKFMKQRGVATSLPVGKPAPFAMRRTSKTQADRLGAILKGDLSASSMELDIGNILRKRGVDHVRWVNTRKLVQDTLTDGRIMRVIRPSEAMDLIGAPGKMAAFKKSLAKDAPGYDVLEVTKKSRDKSGASVDEVIGAYVLPTPIVQSLKKMEGVMSNDDEIGWFLDQASQLTGVWKGWATLSVGFHARNYAGMLFMNWIKGVGASKPLKRIESVFGADVKIPQVQFIRRHLQAFKLQALSEGAGQMPAKAKAVANLLLQATGTRSLDDLSIEVVVQGKKLNARQIIALGEAYDVPQHVSKVSSSVDDGKRMIWQDLEPTAHLRSVETADLSPITQQAFKLESQTGRSAGETASRYLGGDNPLLKANRTLAQTVENNGRWALFLDRLMKGDAPEIAAAATKEMHFDYRNLTNTEKKIFANLIPFYAWQRFAAPKMLMAIVENPGRLAKIPKAKRAIEQLSEDWGDLATPDYYDEVQALQLPLMNSERQPQFAQIDLPILELNRFNKRDVLGSLHPIPKLFAENAPDGGHSFFTGAPLERFAGEIDTEVLGIEKSTLHNLSTLFPPIGKIARLIKAEDRDQIEEALLSELTGVKIRNLDVRRVLRARTFENRRLAREFEQKVRQQAEIARKKAKSE
jgi:hypothetical protein